jgi:hypothetical protein
MYTDGAEKRGADSEREIPPVDPERGALFADMSQVGTRVWKLLASEVR